MLVLSRAADEGIWIGPDIHIVIIEARRNGKVRIGIEAPDGLTVLRDELVAKQGHEVLSLPHVPKDNAA